MAQWTQSDVDRVQARRGVASPKRSKYRNVKVVVDGQRFDSKREAQHWQELNLRKKAGEIRDLKRQVELDLLCPVIHGDDDLGETMRVATYVADFVFTDCYPDITKNSPVRIQDVKGGKATRTALYQLKKKWLFLQYGIEIEEIT